MQFELVATIIIKYNRTCTRVPMFLSTNLDTLDVETFPYYWKRQTYVFHVTVRYALPHAAIKVIFVHISE